MTGVGWVTQGDESEDQAGLKSGLYTIEEEGRGEERCRQGPLRKDSGRASATANGEEKKVATLPGKHYRDMENVKGAALLGIGVVGGFEAGAGDEPAEGVFPSRSMLSSGDIAVAVNHDVDGLDRCRVHGSEIGVFHENDLAVARMLLEILLDCLF